MMVCGLAQNGDVLAMLIWHTPCNRAVIVVDDARPACQPPARRLPGMARSPHCRRAQLPRHPRRYLSSWPKMSVFGVK